MEESNAAASARRRLRWPATILLILTGLAVGYEIVWAVTNMFFDYTPGLGITKTDNDTIMCLSFLALHSVLFWGTLQMRRVRRYPAACCAAGISALPCLSPFCVVGIPFAIWAIVLLVRKEVREAFQKTRSGESPVQ